MELLKRLSIGFFVIAIVLLAIVMGGIRLAIMNIEYFKPEIEYLFERDLAPGFSFTGLSGDVNRFNPILRIENVSMTLPDRSQPLFVDRLAIEFDFWASWRENAPVVREVTGQLEKLELVKDESGAWSTSNVSLMLEPGQGAAPEFRRILAQVPRYLNLNLNRLIMRDQKSGITHQLDGVKAQIDHQQDRFFIKLIAGLPEQLGREVLIKSIVDPDSSVIYLSSPGLQLVPLANLFDLDTLGLQQGELDGEIWINMSGYKVLAVNGELVLNDGVVQLSEDKDPLAISYRSNFSAINLQPNWSIATSLQRLSVDNKKVAGFDIQLKVDDRPDDMVVSAWVDSLQLSSLPVVASQWLPTDISRQIVQGRLEGKLQDILFQVNLERPEEFYFSSRATEVSSQAFEGYPGAENINADILAGRNRMGFRVYGDQVKLDFGDHFTAPLQLDQLEANASAKRLADGLVLAVDDLRFHNQDIKAEGRMWLRADQHDRPFTFIRASFSEGEGSNTSKYLPRNHLPLGAQEWLDRGIKEAYVPEGEMQFHGRLRDIRQLTRERAGEFFVDFAIERGHLFFSPGWLHAREASGRVLFHNVSMDIDLDKASYDKLGNARAKASIADFNDPVLNLKIESETSSELAVDTWLDTPVGKRYRRTMGNLHDMGGTIKTEVNLSMPLSGEDQQPDVLVLLDLDNVSAQSETWGVDLSQVDGRLEVSPSTIKGRKIKAKFFDDPIVVDVDTPKPGGDTQIRARGDIETASLLNKLPSDLTSGMHGRSDWRIVLNLASESTPDSKPFLRLNAVSDLENTAIGIPYPFAKSARDSIRATVDMDFFAEQIWFKASMGSEILGRGQMVVDDRQEFSLNLLDIAFSSGLRAIPRQGLHFYGTLKELSLDDWVRFIRNSSGTNRALLQSIELEIVQASALDRELHDVSLQLNQHNESFLGKIESSIINGSFNAPWRPSPQNPITIDLDYLQIDKLDRETGETDIRPSDLVDFHLNSKELVFHDMLFTNLRVEARAVGDKLQIDNLGLHKEDLVLDGEAQWDYDAATGSHLSSISMSLRGENLGAALDGMGFGETMQNGTLDFSGGFTWPAPLFAFTLDNLVGDARYTIEDGVLKNVEPGTGRFVGLLSISAIPRRLSLDFSDVLIKGMDFDEIKGSYRIEDGILKTRNTRMDGAAAVIKISGETDIAKREYNQNVRVIPKIRQTLPVLGVVSAGTTVGWGLLLLQNLFKKSIDKAVEVEYQITGNWDDPQIELIKAVDENQQEIPIIEKDNR